MNQKGEYLKNLYTKLKRETRREQIVKLLTNNSEEKIEYSPVYQRNYIWNDAKANKLMETILINGEVPPLVGIIDKGKYEIIDGRQRFESILRFANDEFSLKANYLTVIKDLGGCKYSTLPPNVKARFDEYRLKMITYTIENGCNIDEKDLDKVKRDLFRRYNYGMTALSKSEIARAKYLYDDLTNLMRNHFLNNEEDSEIFTSIFLPKRLDNKKNKRNKLNSMLMITRELLTMPYIPIIGVKTVKTGNSVVERYYEKFVKKEDINDKKDEFIKILHILSKIQIKLKEKNNNLYDNTLLFKAIYWMLALLYKFYPNEFYDFKINQFIHYLEEKNDAFEYFELYNNMRTINIINRYNYVKNYISEILQLNIDENLIEIINNRKDVIYKSKTRVSSKENWNGLGTRKQILTIDDTFTVCDMAKYSNENRLIIRPVYQRGEIKSIEKASKIIESICLGIKLPPIYLLVKRNENSLDSYTVIDGQ